MSAQLDSGALPPRHLRFPAPLPASPLRPGRATVYSLSSASVPYPDALAPLLRREAPGRHWALTLGYIYHCSQMAHYTPLQLAAAWRLRDILESNSRNPQAERYVRLLVPVAACQHCSRSFLQESQCREHCSERCRRLDAHTNHGAGIPFTHPPCPVCGATLPSRRTRYCCDDCQQAAERRRRAASATLDGANNGIEGMR